MTKQERFHYLTTGDYQLDRLRQYLSDWQEWERRFKIDLGVPNAVPWAKFMDKQYAEVERTDGSTINVAAMQIVDQSIRELAEKQGELAIAIRWRYLNANVGAQVFRFKRLVSLTLEQLDDLADGAERALLPIAKRRGLML